MLRQSVLESLQARRAKPGETVEFGWFVFKVTGSKDELDLETLDFQAMASFTRDFAPVERIYQQQSATLQDLGVEPAGCTLRQYAVVSRAYRPLQAGAFMCRIGPAKRNDSGWVVGTVEEELNKTSLKNSRPVSVYELSIGDRRMLPFWLLPIEYTVVLYDASHELFPPGTDVPFITFDEEERGRPWWKFW